MTCILTSANVKMAVVVTERTDLSSHEDIVESMSWRSDGSTLASTSKDKQLRLFDVRSATVVQVNIVF